MEIKKLMSISNQLLSNLLFLAGSLLLFSRPKHYQKFNFHYLFRKKIVGILKFFSTQIFAFCSIFLITRSINISIAISFLLSYLPILYTREKTRKAEENRRKSWPLVIDQLSTATASGVALHIALAEIAIRGPVALHGEFKIFRESFLRSGSLTVALNDFVSAANQRDSKSHSRMAAQLKSTILIARDCGGQEIGPILRNLSMHLRQRERTLDEIAIRQNWIKNAAGLASLTPWLLLLLLSMHTQTIAAYNSDSGRIILLIGLLFTAVAYKWITQISKSVSIESR